MTKTDLIQNVQQETKISMREVREIIDKAFEIVAKKVAEGETVSIKNFGSFQKATRAKRSGRHPKTGEAIVIEERNYPKFKAFKAFKEAVNK